jgi:hypothetical protein
MSTLKYRRFEGSTGSVGPEGEGTILPLSVSNYVPVDTTSHPTMHLSYIIFSVVLVGYKT